MDSSIFLVADQNPRFLEKSEEILREEGFGMIPVADGLEAKINLARSRPTGILANVDLPRLDGFELCRYVKKEFDERVPVILMTRQTAGSLRRAREVGADNVLFRPVKKAELLFSARTLTQMSMIARRDSSGSESRDADASMVMKPTKVSQFDFFKAFLAVEIKRARRYGFPLSLMLTVLDDAEEIESTQGSGVLKQLLNGLARAIRRSVRDIDIPVTLRDETILVLMPHTDAEGAAAVAERVRHRIRRSVYREGEVVIRPTISIGTTTHIRDQDRNFSQVMKRASQAVKEASLRGGDQVIAK